MCWSQFKYLFLIYLDADFNFIEDIMVVKKICHSLLCGSFCFVEESGGAQGTLLCLR